MNTTFTYPDGSQMTSTSLTNEEIETVLQITAAQLLGLITGINMYPLTLTSGSPNVVATTILGLYVGLAVVAPGVPASTFITGFDDDNPLGVFLSNNATANGSVNAAVSDPNVWFKTRIGWQTEGSPGPPINDDTVTIICVPLDTEYSRMHDSTLVSASGNFVTSQDVFTRTWKASWTFYGPNSLNRSRAVKSGILKAPFIDAFLKQSNLYINPEIKEPQRVPEKREGQWWERVDLVVEFNEQITETITIGTVLSVEVKVFTKDGEILDTTITGS
jgi:hypothetical protein